MKIFANNIAINERKINFIFLNVIADVKNGITTGDNKSYLYKKLNSLGSYKIINEEKILYENELSIVQNNEDLRNKIIDNGIPDDMFDGRTIVPYDKGGSSDIESGRLSNYYSESEYFINWSESNVKRMKTMTIAQRYKINGQKNIPKKSYKTTLAAVLRNPSFYFLKGITFSYTGLYAPTFRLNSGSIFDVGGTSFFFKSGFEKKNSTEYVLGVLCSKSIRYIARHYINNTVGFMTDDAKKLPIPICEKSQKQEIEKLVKEIIKKQKKDPDYNYQNHEQIEIDNLVYEIFGLDQELVNEVETWYARRYPKLVRN